MSKMSESKCKWLLVFFLLWRERWILQHIYCHRDGKGTKSRNLSTRNFVVIQVKSVVTLCRLFLVHTGPSLWGGLESNAVQGLLTSPTANLLLRKPVVHQCISEHFKTMKGRKFTAGVELTTAAEVTASSPFLELFNVLFNARKEITQKKKP